MKRLGSSVAGFEIGSHVGCHNLGDAYMDPIFKTAEDLGQVLFVHPWDMPSLDGRMDSHWLKWLLGMPGETGTAIASVLLGGVLERFPALKLVFAHGGGSYPFVAGRVEKGFTCRPDLCATDASASPSSFHGRFHVDSLVHSQAALRLLMDTMGEVRLPSHWEEGVFSPKDRVMLGTDYPFPLGELAPDPTYESYDAITPNEKTKVLWDNAAALFHL